MDAAAAGVASASSAATWRRTVRRRSLGAGALPRPREDTAAAEMEAAVWRLRAEKDTAERAAAALRAELDAERGAAGTAASEAMLMIGRLQREKAAAMMEARQFRGLAEGRAGMDRQLQDRLAAVSAVAASYAAQLRTHGVDPEENDGEGDGEDDDYEEHNEAEADGEDQDGDGVVEKAAVVEVLEDTSPSPSPSPSPAEEFVYTVDVPCATEKMAAAAERVDAGAAAGLSLQARVEALEADREAVRREAAAARVERAQVALAREVARRLFLEAAARTMVARTAAAVAPPEAPRFSVVAICKWFISTILLSWGKKRSAVRLMRILRLAFRNHRVSNPVLHRPMLLEGSNGDHQILSSRRPSHSKMPVNEVAGLAGSERPLCSPL